MRIDRGTGLLLAVTLASAFGCRSNFPADRTRCDDGACPTGHLCIRGFCEQVDLPDAAPVDTQSDAAPLRADSERGNVITYTFDGDTNAIVIDRSAGTRFDGERGLLSAGGIYGLGGLFQGFHEVRIPDTPLLTLGNQLTIEAWIEPAVLNQPQAIFGDFDIGDTPPVEYALELASTNQLAFRTNDGCASLGVVLGSVDASFVVGRWAHVAVTWDGETVSFYVDAELVGTQPLSATPCESPTARPFKIGEYNDETADFVGRIDEVKISDYAKTQAEIAASRAFVSVDVFGVCGDSVSDLPAECIADQECCSEMTCRAEPNGTACGNGDTCQAGVCDVAVGRTTTGLIALYEFLETTGATVQDTSGFGVALDLTIEDELNVTHGASTLTVDTAVLIRSTVPATKISTAVGLTNELTVELWVDPLNQANEGPARVVSMSIDAAQRNFTLGQQRDEWIMRLRSATSGPNGYPQINSAANEVRPGQPNHVVVTMSAEGIRRLYVDGILRNTNRAEGGLGTWEPNFELVLANEVDGLREFIGTYHLVAIFDRALTELEVAAHFNAGP